MLGSQLLSILPWSMSPLWAQAQPQEPSEGSVSAQRRVYSQAPGPPSACPIMPVKLLTYMCSLEELQKEPKNWRDLGLGKSGRAFWRREPNWAWKL